MKSENRSGGWYDGCACWDFAGLNNAGQRGAPSVVRCSDDMMDIS